MADPAYDQLIARLREVTLLGTMSSALHWDQETYLPKAATPYRGDQLAWLSGRAHALFTDPEVGEWIGSAARAGFDPESTEGVNVRWLQRQYDKATKLPGTFVEECAKTQTMANAAWIEARRERDFARFAPHLEALTRQARQRADYLGYADSRYDALLDEHEPGATTSGVGALFDSLAPTLSELVAAGAEACANLPVLLPPGPYPEETQRVFNAEVAAAIGFDFDAGRIDTTTHPFCTTLGPRDHRITNRYDPADFTSSLYCILHETGHALYEIGLPEDQFGLPCGSAASLGIHESQSRLWENHVGRSLAFWEHWFDRAQALFPQLAGTTPEALWQHVNRIERTFIRVEADEVTYDLHIILRFRLERALVEGEIEVADIPATWNAMFAELMGLQVDHDSHGCLQDVHWSFGGFGYFATYSLGNINAAQLMAAATRQVAGLQAQLASGQYRALLGWLREHVHQPGMRHFPVDLMQRATGQPVSPDAHLSRLAEKISLFG